MTAGLPSARIGLAFGILGPLQVLLSGQEVPLAGSRQRALLAYLLLHAQVIVSSERLIDELFGDEPPDNALNSVHTGISRLRRQLAAAGVVEVPILTRAPGYVLEIDRDQLDLHRFENLLDHGREELASGDPGAAAETLRLALGLWRGHALDDLSGYGFARTEAARLEELRLAALSARIEADLALGRHAEVIGELELLTAEHPLQEGLRAQLMLALYRSGRQADALQVYQDTRRELVSELGLEPGKALQQLEQAVLTQDPTLDAPARRDTVLPALGGRRLQLALPVALVVAAVVALAFLLLRDDAPSLVAQPNSVAVIDTETNRVTDVVGVGRRPGALSAGFGAVWASNVGDSTVTRIDANTARVTRVLSLERAANGLAAGGGFLWAFASDSLLLPRPGVVDRIDPRYGVVIDTARIPDVSGTGGIAYGRNAAWVAAPLGLLTRLDRRTNEPVSTVDTGGSPEAVAVGAGAVWVVHPEAGTVVRVDPASEMTGVSIPVGKRPVALAATGRTVWVADDATDTLVEIDSATNTVRGTVVVGRRPTAVVASAGAVWVANSGDGTVTRVDSQTRRVEAVIRVGGAPSGLAIAGRRVWVSVAPPAAATSAAEGGVVRATAEGPLDSLDPALAASTLSWQIEHATCLKLVNHPDRPPPAGSRLVPDAASGIPRPLSRGTTYVFRIRPGLRFSPPSNQPVNARTFKETIERAANPRLDGFGGSYVGDIVGMDAYVAGRASHVKGIHARGELLRIRLRAPAPDLLARLAMPFFCAVPTGTPIDPEGLHLIPSAGPFYVVTYEPEHSVVLRRNPGYHGARPQGAQEIRITLGVPRERGLQAVLGDESDHALDGVPPTEAAGLRRQFPGRFYESPQIQLGFVALNTSRPLFSTARLRRAAALAVDRRELALGGAGHTSPSAVPTDQYLPPGMQGFRDVDIYPLRPDLARARRLAGAGTRFGVLYTCNLPFCVRQAAVVTRNLREIGISLVVERFAIPELLERLGRRGEPFDVAIPPGWFADFLDPSQYLNVLLDGRTIQAERNGNFAYFDDDAYVRKLARIERLAGVRRVLAYGELDVETARDSAPLIAYANATRLDFFSERVGCQAYNPAYGMSLAALCLSAKG